MSAESEVHDRLLAYLFDQYLVQVAYELKWGYRKLRSTPVLVARGKGWRFRSGRLRRVDVYRRLGGKWAAFYAGYPSDSVKDHGLFFVSDEGLRGYFVTSTNKGQVIRLAKPPATERELKFWLNGLKVLRGEKPGWDDEYLVYSRAR